MTIILRTDAGAPMYRLSFVIALLFALVCASALLSPSIQDSSNHKLVQVGQQSVPTHGQLIPSLSNDAWSQVASIPVGSTPQYDSYDPFNGAIYVTNEKSDNVSVISGNTNAVTNTTRVGSDPWGDVYDSGEAEEYVANIGSANISVISSSTNGVTGSISAPADPEVMSYDAVKGEVFLLVVGSDDVCIIPDGAFGCEDTVAVASDLLGLAYDNVTGETFVSSASAGAVYAINDSSNTVAHTISIGVGTDPEGIGFDWQKGELFVADEGTGQVSVISDASNSVVSTVDVGDTPENVVYDSGAGVVLVSKVGPGGNISVVSDTLNRVVDNVTVGTTPYGMAYDNANGGVYVVNEGSDNVSVLSPETISVTAKASPDPAPTIAAISFNATTSGGAAGETFKWIFGDGVTSTARNPIHAYSVPGTYLARVYFNASPFSAEANVTVSVTNWGTTCGGISTTVGAAPWGEAVGASPSDLYVGDVNSDNVTVIDLSTFTTTGQLPVGQEPRHVAVDPGASELFTGDYGASNVTVDNLTSPSTPLSINVGSGPTGVLYDSATDEVIVANDGSNSLSIIDPHTNVVSRTVTLTGMEPNGLMVDPFTNELWVSEWESDEVQVLNTTTWVVAATLHAGNGTSDLAYDPQNELVFASNQGTDNVTVYNGTTLTFVRSIPVGSAPIDIAYDSNSSVVLVADDGSFYGNGGMGYGGVSVIDVDTLRVIGNITEGQNPDGITYDPATGIAYVANAESDNVSQIDGACLSKLFPPLSASLALSNSSVESGTPVTATSIVRNGTAIVYDWSLNGSISLSPGCPAQGSECNITLVHGATYQVNLTVTDSFGRRAWSQSPLTVTYPTSPPPPLVASVALHGNDTHPGTPSWANATVSGGGTPYNYTWALNGTAQIGVQPSLEFIPRGPGFYNLTFTVSDNLGQTAVKGTMLRVLPNRTSISPLTVTLSANAEEIVAGQTVSLTAVGSGGVSPYSYEWALNGTNDSSIGSTPSLFRLLSYPGNYTYRVWVTDAVPSIAGSNTVKIEVLPSTNNSPLIVTLSANRTEFEWGGSVTFTSNVSGGDSLFYNYLWSRNGTNYTYLGHEATLSLIPGYVGNYTYQVWVTDAKGHVAGSPVVTIEVLPATTTPPPNPGPNKGGSLWSSSLFLGGFLGVVLIAILLVALFAARRRRKVKPSGTALTGQSSRIPPVPPADYLAGVTIGSAVWDEATPSEAFGTYTVGAEEHKEFLEETGGASASSPPTPSKVVGKDAFRPWSINITPEGIAVEELAASAAKPQVIDAHFVKVDDEGKTDAPAGPREPRMSSEDAYALLQALATKPRSLDGLKQLVKLDDFELFALLSGLSRAKLIARGTQDKTGTSVFVLTPLGRKLGRRFLAQEKGGKVAPEALPAAKPAAKPARAPLTLGKGARVQDAQRIGKERGTLEEESPFEGLRPEDVNPQLKGAKPLPKSVLQPMEMRVTQDRGSDVRDTTPVSDSDKKAADLIEAAKKAREAKKSKMGVQQMSKPPENQD